MLAQRVQAQAALGLAPAQAAQVRLVRQGVALEAGPLQLPSSRDLRAADRAQAELPAAVVPRARLDAPAGLKQAEPVEVVLQGMLRAAELKPAELKPVELEPVELEQAAALKVAAPEAVVVLEAAAASANNVVSGISPIRFTGIGVRGVRGVCGKILAPSVPLLSFSR